METWKRNAHADALRDANGQALSRGSFVITDAEEYRGRWWFMWPGLVVSCGRRLAKVEFCGFGKFKLRRIRLPGSHLKPITSDDTLSKLYAVANFLNRTPRGGELERGALVTQQGKGRIRNEEG